MAFFDGWSKMGHDVFFRTNQLHDCEVTFDTHCLAKEKIWKSILGAKYDQQTNFHFNRIKIAYRDGQNSAMTIITGILNKQSLLSLQVKHSKKI